MSKWRILSLCTNIDPEAFFELYEDSENVAKVIDEVCLSCPVRKDCLSEGIKNKEYGVWGGVFLNNGKIDKARNAHKTKEVWEQIG